MKPRNQISEEFRVDVDQYSFFDQMWDDWMPVTDVIPVDSADYDAWLSDDSSTDPEPEGSVNRYDPLDRDGVTNEQRNAITSFRSWGQGPVLAAMKGLDIFEINNSADADSVIDWLDENYDSIFDSGFGGTSGVPQAPKNTYVAKEMDITYQPKYGSDHTVKIHAYGGFKNKIDASPTFDFSAFTNSSNTNSLYDIS